MLIPGERLQAGCGAGMEVKQWNRSPSGSHLALMGFVFPNSWEPQNEG